MISVQGMRGYEAIIKVAESSRRDIVSIDDLISVPKPKRKESAAIVFRFVVCAEVSECVLCALCCAVCVARLALLFAKFVGNHSFQLRKWWKSENQLS